MFRSSGILVYLSDYRARLDCDAAISKYFRKLYAYSRWNTEVLSPPSHGVHVTIISGELIREKLAEDQEIEFHVQHEVATNGNAFWLPVVCPEAENIREQLSLPREPKLPFHICIGYKEFGKLKNVEI